MAAPIQSQVVSPPPAPDISGDDLFRLLSELWERTGRYNSAVTNLAGLVASVKQLNTLVGIKTDTTVQLQLDSKQPAGSLGSMAVQDANSVNISGGTISNVTHNTITIQLNSVIKDSTISNSVITFPTGDVPTVIYPGGKINLDTTSVSNTLAAETDLITYTLPANVLNNNDYFLEITSSGIVGANANNKTIKLYLGSTLLLTTGAVAANSGSWEIKATIIRTGASQEKCSCCIISSNNLILDSNTYTLAAEDTSTNLAIKCTGQGTATGDITQEFLIIKLYK